MREGAVEAVPQIQKLQDNLASSTLGGVRAIPFDLRAKLEPAEVFHQMLEHRWYMSQAQGRSVPLAEALTSYIDEVLRHRRDEATIMGPPTETVSIPVVGADQLESDADEEEIDWRDLV